MAKQGKYVYDWPRPMVTVDTVVFGHSRHIGTKVLLIKRGKKPYKGMWALPGGFVELDEELEAAAARELAEETGLVGVKLKQLHTFGKCGRDPRGRQISVVYTGIVEIGLQNVQGGDDADAARWFEIEDLPAELAFDHSRIIEFAVSKMRRS